MPTATDGSIRYHHDPAGVTTFAVLGRGTMRQSPAFADAAREALARGDAVRVELCDCSYMDSTFLGTLVGLNRTARSPVAAPGNCPGPRFALIAPSAECQKLVHQMGMDKLIPITPARDDAPPVSCPAGGPTAGGPSTWQTLAIPDTAPATVQETVVRAHQDLSEAPGPAAQQFKAIAAKLAKAWESEHGKGHH